ncbi:MAG: hypothetical protein H0X17_09095 [Deltaproteobacteria bacterium]|nr:hypothetical protein [Deltaproteobacteria bacterium]
MTRKPRRADYFTELGERIEDRWRARDYADAALPPIAEEELQRRPPHEHVSPWELAQVGRNPRRMLEQGSAGFGQPPLAVWGSGSLYIEVLYWLQATTAIHQHSFSGAFAVLEGSSLHTQYRFRPEQKVSDHLHIGRLAWTGSELLTRGSVHQIGSGPRFIHSLFHLDHPSVSVVVRNYQDADAPPQLGYFPPGLGVEDSLVEPRLARALELYRMLVDIGRVRDAEQIVAGIVKQPDLMSVYLALEAIGDSDVERAIGQRIRARARKLHGAVVDPLATAIELEREARRVTLLRSRVTDSDLRYFLALLLVVPTPAALRRLIADRIPGQDVATTVMRWLTALTELHAFPFHLDAVQLRMIELMMRGQSFATIVQTFARDGGSRVTAAHRSELRRQYDAMKTWPYLDRLLAPGRGAS